MTVTHNGYTDDLIFENIVIVGVQEPVASVKVSQHGMGETRLSSSLFSYDADKKVKWVSNTRATLPAAGRNPVKSIHPSIPFQYLLVPENQGDTLDKWPVLCVEFWWDMIFPEKSDPIIINLFIYFIFVCFLY